MTTYDPDRTDYRDAALILRGLDERIADLEQTGSGSDAPIQLSRQEDEFIVIRDTISATVNDAGSFTWNVDDYGRAAWGGPGTGVERAGLTVLTSFRATEQIESVDESASMTQTVHFDSTEAINEIADVNESASMVAFAGFNVGAATAPASDTQFEEASLTLQAAFFAGEVEDGGEGGVEIPDGTINLNDEGMGQGDTIQNWWNENDDMSIDPGTYVWDGNGPDLNGITLYGKGNPGDVVLEVQDGSTFSGDGRNGGGYVNIRTTGTGFDDSKSGMNIGNGSRIRLFVHRDGLYADEDRFFYTPDGGGDRNEITQSSWVGSPSDGAYTDKPLMTFRHCVAENNNISQYRTGHRDGTDVDAGNDYMYDSICAVTDTVPNDSINSKNARGLRIRHPLLEMHVVRSLFDYRDFDGASGLIVWDDDATAGELHLDRCVFYNEGPGDLINDQWGDLDIILDGDVVIGGPGNMSFEGNVSGPGEIIDLGSGMAQPDWDWRAVCYNQESPVAPYFDDVDGDPTTYP